ncbi:hypothetical protein BJY01DRAFT_47012 [Aspergillus pseudoustus]|uniref:Uncharacterized protein n=1 Tax=Aspergillus pseudoustus TaxID=1810923 RepID=A0ABR4JAT6_9EURO
MIYGAFIIFLPLSLHINNNGRKNHQHPGEFKGLRIKGFRPFKKGRLWPRSSAARDWHLQRCLRTVLLGSHSWRHYFRECTGALLLSLFRKSAPLEYLRQVAQSHGKVRGNVGSKSTATLCLLWVGLRSFGRKSLPALVGVGIRQRMPLYGSPVPIFRQRPHDSGFSTFSRPQFQAEARLG